MKWLFITIMILTLTQLVSAQSIMPVKCDGTAATNEFEVNESLCLYGTGFDSNQTVDVYVVNESNLTAGSTLSDITEEVETVTVTQNGIFSLKNIWKKIVDGVYNIIVDISQNGSYDEEDVVNSVQTPNQNVNPINDSSEQNDEEVEQVPEWPTIGAGVLLGGIALFIHKRRREEV